MNEMCCAVTLDAVGRIQGGMTPLTLLIKFMAQVDKGHRAFNL